MVKSSQTNNGVYYFLGTISSHIIHALPLYEQLGGTFVVTSKKTAQEIARYNVPVVQLDDINHDIQKQVQRVRSKLKLSNTTFRLGRSVRRTFNYLEENARVVIFYELFEFTSHTKLSQPKTIFLTHGNMLKDYFGMYPHRKEIIKQYDYMAGLGPLLKKDFTTRHGIDSSKFIDVGIARTDELYHLKNDATLRKKIADEVGFNPNKTIVSYFTTYWGASSIYNTAKEILKNVDDPFVILFQLHPQVPLEIRHEYEKIIENKPNVFWAHDTLYPSLNLPATLCVGDIILGDVSSVILEGILIDRPMVFVYDIGEHRQKDSDYRMIKKVVEWSEYIDMDNVTNVNQVLRRALKSGINETAWRQTKDDTFYHHDGTSVQSIADFISRLAFDTEKL